MAKPEPTEWLRVKIYKDDESSLYPWEVDISVDGEDDVLFHSCYEWMWTARIGAWYNVNTIKMQRRKKHKGKLDYKVPVQ